MGGLGCGCALIAALFAVIAAIPFLGWLNWFLVLPPAALAVVFGVAGLAANQQRTAAGLALGGGLVVLFWALLRLGLGHGIL